MTRRTINPGQAFARSEEYAAIVAWFEAGNTGASRDVPTIMAFGTAHRYVKHAYAAGLLFICAWERRCQTSGPPLAIYAYQTGGLKDAVRPPPTPSAVKTLKWAKSPRGKAMTKLARARRRKDPETHLGELLYQKARYARNNPKTVEQIDPLLAALTRRK